MELDSKNPNRGCWQMPLEAESETQRATKYREPSGVIQLHKGVDLTQGGGLMASVAGSFAEIQESASGEWERATAPEFGKRRLSHRDNEQIVGSSRGFQSVWNAVEMVAPTDAAVLILGETGTGKEVCARAIHENSLRKRGPFVKVNCAAIPSGLLESELFGHERGAFTGALNQTVGRFQLADRGTLFLDEIGDLPLELQPKLLRALQEQEFERLGSARTIRVDVRIVAATNQNLLELVRLGKFRADLYYRLSVFPIAIPPLRERSEDVPALVWHFLRRSAGKIGKSIDTIPAEVMAALRMHDWPGNIRELQNFLERSVILTTGAVLRPPLEDLKKLVRESNPAARRTLVEAERDHIREVLEQTNWVIGGPEGAAARLGIARTTLLYRIRKLGISRSI